MDRHTAATQHDRCAPRSDAATSHRRRRRRWIAGIGRPLQRVARRLHWPSRSEAPHKLQVRSTKCRLCSRTCRRNRARCSVSPAQNSGLPARLRWIWFAPQPSRCESILAPAARHTPSSPIWPAQIPRATQAVRGYLPPSRSRHLMTRRPFRFLGQAAVSMTARPARRIPAAISARCSLGKRRCPDPETGRARAASENHEVRSPCCARCVPPCGLRIESARNRLGRSLVAVRFVAIN